MTSPAREGAAARTPARREIGLDDVVEHFTLDDRERELLRNTSGSTRLGFAAMLKFLGWKGRFPRGLFELPDDAIEHLARQVKVAAAQIGAYDFTGRQIKNHRREIRTHTGFRICTVRDGEQFAGWLAAHIAQDERRAEHVRAMLLARCKNERIEPPAPERASRIVDSAIRQADAILVTTVVGRLDPGHIARIEALLTASVATDVDTDSGERRVEGDGDELSAIKASPGNVSLATVLNELDKLHAVRQVGLPPGLFDGIAANVVAAWRARAAVESPSHLARHDQPVRLVLLAALLHLNPLALMAICAPVSVRPAARKDFNALALVLARAFYDDPVTSWFYPDAGSRLRLARRFFASGYASWPPSSSSTRQRSEPGRRSGPDPGTGARTRASRSCCCRCSRR